MQLPVLTLGTQSGSNEDAPNPRVQRTRSSASRRRAPLTRRPLGGQDGISLPSAFLGIVVVAVLAVGCHGSDEVSSPWASLEGSYRADFNASPCGPRTTADVVLMQSGSEVSGSIPGFGGIAMTAATLGQLPRVTDSTLVVEHACGESSGTYTYLPTDDGSVLTWSFPGPRGENCGCGTGTIGINLVLTPR
jgi:hypothetical protein